MLVVVLLPREGALLVALLPLVVFLLPREGALLVAFGQLDLIDGLDALRLVVRGLLET